MSKPRLSLGLNQLKNESTLTSPDASPSTSKSIVHLGIGAFHRAHQAVYTQEVNTKENNWHIIGASLRSESVYHQLSPQDFCYTVVERENDHESHKIIHIVKDVIVAPLNTEKLIEVIASPQCEIVSLTITEKGYCHDPASGQLDFSHPDIIHDLSKLEAPKTAVGIIVCALACRMKEGLSGLTVLSCDNLPSNGALTFAVLKSFAEKVNGELVPWAELVPWIETHCTFPSSMVDRIVPATTEQDKQGLEQSQGYCDEAVVICEPFRQWVIEDNFAGSRPDWEKAGVLMVESVNDYETMKLRMLNGSHSAIAYLGFMAGFETVSDVMANESFKNFIQLLMAKGLIPSINVPSGVDVKHYQTQLIGRFSNSALNHKTQQIAMDGSQKLPQRLLAPLSEMLELSGLDAGYEALCLSVAAWMRYTNGINEGGQIYKVDDPLNKKLLTIHAKAGGKSDSIVKGFMTLAEVFPEALIESKQFRERCAYYLEALFILGSCATVKAFMEKYNG